jgi:dUTP pyrophosphatase
MNNLTIEVEFEKLPGFENISLPGYESPQAAGMDVRAALEEPVVLKPGERKLIPTGFKMALPQGYEAQIRPRSGLAMKHGITMLNTPGTIDADYRGEVKVLAVNLGDQPFTIENGNRIAQMVIAPVTHATIRQVKKLKSSDRGAGGFGSTGIE